MNQSILLISQKKINQLEVLASIINIPVSDIDNTDNLFLDKKEGIASIGIGDLEGIFEWAYKMSEKIRLLVINNAQSLTPEAQNMLLKIVEEPPENIQIILISNNISDILLTIRSRCLIVRPDKETREQEENNEQINKFLLGNYLERVEIIDRIFKNKESSRVELSHFLEELFEIMTSEQQIANLALISESIKNIKAGVNSKLILTNLALNLT